MLSVVRVVIHAQDPFRKVVLVADRAPDGSANKDVWTAQFVTVTSSSSRPPGQSFLATVAWVSAFPRSRRRWPWD